MAHIKYHDKSLGFNLEDIKFIKVKDMFTFYQKLLSEEIKIYDETNFISKHNLCILPSTKISDLFNFSKINVLGKHLIEWINDKNINLANEEIKNIVSHLSTLFDGVEFNQDYDKLAIVSKFIDINERIINKKDFVSLINLLDDKMYNTKILLFNSEWIDEEVINLLNEKNLKTIIIFNESNNLLDILKQNKENIIVFKENNFSFIDVKSDIPDEYDDNIEKIFIKL